MATLPTGAERRRSQRILLVMPVQVSWTTKEGVRVREHGETEVVNAHGGLLRMKSRLPMAGEIEVIRPQTRQAARARVVSVSGPGPDGLTRVAIELAVPGEAFWGIIIPRESGAASG